jgi:hypothetical protein
MSETNNFDPNQMNRQYVLPVSPYRNRVWLIPFCAVFVLLGLPAFIASFDNLETLRYMNSLTSWLFSAIFSLTGTITAAFQIKKTGFQPAWEKWTMVGIVSFGVVMSSAPVISTLLYGAGIGN